MVSPAKQFGLGRRSLQRVQIWKSDVVIAASPRISQREKTVLGMVGREAESIRNAGPSPLRTRSVGGKARDLLDLPLLPGIVERTASA